MLTGQNYIANGLEVLWLTRQSGAMTQAGRADWTLFLPCQKESLQKTHDLGCTIPSRGVLWPETCKLRAATVGRISPSALPINSFFRNAVTRPQSVANLAARQRRTIRGDPGHRSAPSQGTPVICSGCGQPTTVPFEPRGDRPVYCRDCYTARKGTGGGGGRGR